MTGSSPLTGTLLGGRYRVGALLGAGGMGAVYEGVQEGLDRKVALKVLHPHLAGDKELLGRFQREAHLVAALGHPNVVQISDFQAPPGEPPFLVMERLQGENLRDALKRSPQMPQERVGYIAMQVLSALDAAHRANIVHRDIKPDNIFLERTNVQADIVKVLDFGVAKLLDADREEESGNRLTRQGFVVGTLAYMAPEQASGEGVDGRSDLYALGACMYVALAGRKPFEAPSTTELLRAMLSDAPVPLTAIRQDIDDGLWQVLARALAKDKKDRFATAADMARALAPFAKPTTLEVAVSIKPLAPPPTDSHPASTQSPPTIAETPHARGSDAITTPPDDSGEAPVTEAPLTEAPLTASPHTAPLPTRPTPPAGTPATQPAPTLPLTQPMPATPPLDASSDFAKTARMSPATVAMAYQATPPPVAVEAKRRPRSALWALVAAAAALGLGVVAFVAWHQVFGQMTTPTTVAAAATTPAPTPPAAAPSGLVVAATGTPADSTGTLEPLATEPLPTARPSPTNPLGGSTHAFVAPRSPAATASAIPATGHQPLVCETAKRLQDMAARTNDRSTAQQAARLVAQCTAQGGHVSK